MPTKQPATQRNSAYFASPTVIEDNLREYSLSRNEILPKLLPKIPVGGEGGVPLSYTKGKVFIDHTDSHTLVIGPTASKKSRLIVMPTVKILAAAKESMIISDPKAEIFKRTAADLDKSGYKITVLNLRDPLFGSCWNPLHIPYKLYCQGEIDRVYEFANDVAMSLTAIDKSNKEPFWDNSAGSLFFGLTLLLFKYCQEFNKGMEAVNLKNIFRMRNIMCSGNSLKIQNSPLWNYAKTDDFIASILIGTIETANDTRAGILSMFDQKMRAFAIQPNLLDMLAFNDFDFGDITMQPTAFFLIVPDEKTSYHGLVSLFIKQSYEYIIFKAQSKKADITSNIRVNYILDEFSSLPTVNDFPAMITAARSRNIRFNIIIQSKHQLQLRYEEESETIQTNCTNWIFLTSRELKLLEEISALCGKTNATNEKPVLSVSDLQRFNKEAGEALILSGRHMPYIACLPDIDEYDGGMPKPYEFPVRSKRDSIILNFELPESFANTLPANNLPQGLPPGLRPPFDVGRMIKEIENKIVELEAEEKNQK